MPRVEATLRNVRVMWRDFDGQGLYSRPGVFTFHIRLEDEELIHQLQEDGWDVRIYIPKNDPDADPVTHLKATIRFDKYPPAIWLVNDKQKTKLDEESIGILQTAAFEKVDVFLSQSHWENPRGEGTTAYVQSMYVTLRQDDPFADEYNFDRDELPF